MTENEARITGVVRDISEHGDFVTLLVYTKAKHNGRRYPKYHVIRVRKGDEAYGAAKITRNADYVGIKGTIHRDNSIIAFFFHNFNFCKDGRDRLLMNLPEPESPSLNGCPR
jgi:hypothetical protein